MHASDEPMVDVPMVCSGSGACHRSASIVQHRVSTAAVCGYSSLSIMFLSAASRYSRAACSSIHVPTNVARLSRAFPSSIASSWTIWYAVSWRDSSSGKRNLGSAVASPGLAKTGLSSTTSVLRCASRPGACS